MHDHYKNVGKNFSLVKSVSPTLMADNPKITPGKIKIRLDFDFQI